MRMINSIFFIIFVCMTTNAYTTENEKKEVIFLRPNTTQMFTELYQTYGLLDNPPVNVFDNSMYLDQTGEPPILPLQPPNVAIFKHAESVLRKFHESQKNLELFLDPNDTDAFFYTSNGSIQIIFGLVYAIATSEPNKKFVFVEKIPYYSGHENSVGKLIPYQNARFQGFHDVKDIKLEPDEVLVEFVTSPNNPDGKFRKPFTDASIIIADFVFASPVFGTDGTGYLKENIEWVKEARSEGKHIFSFNSASKQYGKTGNRVGYLWYPMKDPYAKSIFDNYFKYISSTTVAGNTTGLSDFLNLISAFLALPDTGAQLRSDGHETLLMRHEIIKKELLKKYPGSTVSSLGGSPTLFAKIVDSRIPETSAATVILEDTHTSINPGTIAGEDPSYIRLNLSGYTDELVTFANRLSRSDTYTKKDMFVSSEKVCEEKTLCSEVGKTITYTASPEDCKIYADTSHGPIKLFIPPFIGYRGITLTISKTGQSDYPVTVSFGDEVRTLKDEGEKITIEWKDHDFVISNKPSHKYIDK